MTIQIDVPSDEVIADKKPKGSIPYSDTGFGIMVIPEATNAFYSRSHSVLLNRKKDRFTITNRELVRGETHKGHPYERWATSFSVSVTVKTPNI